MVFYYEKLDHVQLTAPKDEEQTAKAFYVHILGFKEINKPKTLQKNGGIWLQSGDVHIHIGVEEPFMPAKKAHPAIYVKHLEKLKRYLQEHDVAYLEDERLPNYKRFYVSDPFGNRLEFLEKS
ncbi:MULTISPECIES: VOC family protein [Virgibacillus]|uniref:Glyoxalase-like domain protein n=1 Tax=Virgibacillus dokdonensis TaxID=302167 RepID=A0A2K9J107_9BACI|nr:MULTISPECIES: VOC family protein [Virgibacillus]AUJ25638.1 Glyoxalase-like domain protein [Virgibacillus dokdonensis]NWO12150.1 VOC family protein [Virgibacillus sp.]